MSGTITEQPAVAIELQRFCGKETGTKYAMHQPFVRGGWRYATDGRIMVRIPAPGEADTPRLPGVGNWPPVESLISECPLPDDGWIAWPLEGMVREVAPCPQCGGRGKIVCDMCDDFSTACLMCLGAKKFEQDTRFILGAHHLAPKHAKLIAALPGVRVFPGVRELTPIPFVFDGGDGRVMGMRKD